MIDLISRQVAIDALCKAGCGCGYCGISCEDIAAIEELPAAQPYTEADIQKMQDLEQAELEKAFELGRQDAMSEIVQTFDGVTLKLFVRMINECHKNNQTFSLDFNKDGSWNLMIYDTDCELEIGK